MTEPDRDEDLSRRYRELAREEPPRALDEAILAAARREVQARPAPLVAPSGRRRWYVPVAAAAVIVLSAVVTLHVQREQPDEELGAPQPMRAPAARKDVAPAVPAPAEMREERVAPQPKDIDALRADAKLKKAEPERRQRQAAPAAKPEAIQQAEKPQLAAPAAQAMAPVPPSSAEAGASIAQGSAKESKVAAEPRPFTPDPAPVVAAPPAPPASATEIRPAAPAMKAAPRLADSAASSAPPAGAAQGRALGGLRDSTRYEYRANREDQAESPEKMLDRIAALRREGRTKEADDLYAEFKRRYPEYKIPEAMRDQVLPR